MYWGSHRVSELDTLAAEHGRLNNAMSSGERGKPGSSIKGTRVGLIGSQGVIVAVEGIIRIRLDETKVRRVRYQLSRSTSRFTVGFEGKRWC